MTKTYTQVLERIEALKTEAEQLRRKEVDGVVERIRDAIAHYGLSAADLGLAGGTPKAAKSAKAAPKPQRGAKAARTAKASKAPKAARVVKFRNDAGGTWGGIGKRPQWLRDALAAGKTLQDFAVQ